MATLAFSRRLYVFDSVPYIIYLVIIGKAFKCLNLKRGLVWRRGKGD